MNKLVDMINTAIKTVQASAYYSLSQKKFCLNKLHNALFALAQEWSTILPKQKRAQIIQEQTPSNPTLIQQSILSVLAAIAEESFERKL